MEEKSNIIFNISGGTQQILPNATQGIQNFYGDQFAENLQQVAPSAQPASADEEAQQFALYINNKERAREYIEQFRRCVKASDAGRIVASIVEHSDISEEKAVTEAFIERFVPFLRNVAKGKGSDNLRTHINNALAEQKRLNRRKRDL